MRAVADEAVDSSLAWPVEQLDQVGRCRVLRSGLCPFTRRSTLRLGGTGSKTATA